MQIKIRSLVFVICSFVLAYPIYFIAELKIKNIKIRRLTFNAN
jgi:hypothetical protein